MVKVLSKTMDSTTLSPEKVELCTLSRDEATGKVGNWRQTLGHTPGGGELGGVGLCAIKRVWVGSGVLDA